MPRGKGRGWGRGEPLEGVRLTYGLDKRGEVLMDRGAVEEMVAVLRGSGGYDPWRCHEMADRLLRAMNKDRYTAEDRERDRVIRAALDGAELDTPTRKVA